ncbi:Zinc finger CDGSH type [Aphelenchoides besseyi]|nr:Zinc finger CDGSH type [Aphelenchoides besseyi]
MHITRTLSQRLTGRLFASKTGFGPYRQHKKSSTLRWNRTESLEISCQPNEPYGLQGNNHLQKQQGKIHSKLPTRVFMKKDKVYAWCSCGYSGNQPLCDGTHNTYIVPHKDMKPVRFIPDRDMEVWLCNCKRTKNRPFCDGSHRYLKGSEAENETLFD